MPSNIKVKTFNDGLKVLPRLLLSNPIILLLPILKNNSLFTDISSKHNRENIFLVDILLTFKEIGSNILSRFFDEISLIVSFLIEVF